LLLALARYIWYRFCEGLGTNQNLGDLGAISKYHFIPILSELRYMAITWTQAYVPDRPPPPWITQLLSFTPLAEQVVRHLVELATLVTPRCSPKDVQSFSDLEATYIYLNDA
jgi:hypothetical protein